MPNSGQKPDIERTSRDDPASPSFVAELRRTLHHLYDWTRLRQSRLLCAFDLEDQDEASAALREILRDAIEALKPEADVPSRARSWRMYHLLYSRFMEQFTQQEVATELGLSVRHVRREEHDALEHLASYLWRQYDLSGRWSGEQATRPGEKEEDAPATDAPSSPEQELEWLEESALSEAVGVQALLQGVLDLVRSTAHAPELHVEWPVIESLPDLLVPLTLIRQALLAVFTTVIQTAPGRAIPIRAQVEGSRVCIDIEAEGGLSALERIDPAKERLTMARQLVEMSGGSLTVIADREGDQPQLIRIAVPAKERIPVLVIDDNADTLQLLKRYLSNSRYRFIGTSAPAQAVHLAETASPRAIVLDVMLPGIDGWELLGRLRQHPNTCDIPTIVCTILPQEQLALDLGATAFIRKPVSRQAFLAQLDRQLSLPSTAST
jgi:CheY-like chemotaxis protein